MRPFFKYMIPKVKENGTIPKVYCPANTYEILKHHAAIPFFTQ